MSSYINAGWLTDNAGKAGAFRAATGLGTCRGDIAAAVVALHEDVSRVLLKILPSDIILVAVQLVIPGESHLNSSFFRPAARLCGMRGAIALSDIANAIEDIERQRNRGRALMASKDNLDKRKRREYPHFVAVEVMDDRSAWAAKSSAWDLWCRQRVGVSGYAKQGRLGSERPLLDFGFKASGAAIEF